MKRVLLTGASGFVGANVARRLLRDGHETHLLLRPSHKSWRLREIAGDVQAHSTLLHDPVAVSELVGRIRPDWILHLAAFGAYASQTGMAAMVETNLMSTVALLEGCVRHGVEAFVQTGSSSEYGWKDHAAREDEALQPNSHYAITKAAATHFAQFTSRERDIHAVTLRLYSIYGPYEEPTRFIPLLLTRALEGRLPPLVSPAIARDFVYVDDAVDAILMAAQNIRLPRASVLNVASGTQSTIGGVVELVRRLLGVSDEPVWSSMGSRSWDTTTWVGCPEAIHRELGWTASTDLESGLLETVEWLRARPDLLGMYASGVIRT